MKKLLMAVVIVGVMPLMADTEYANGYTWTYRINGDTAELGDYDDVMGWSGGISPEPTGAVTIPSTLGGKPVTCIRSFGSVSEGTGGYDGLTSLTIPASVKEIANCVFGDCYALTDLVVPTWCKNAQQDPSYGYVVAQGVGALSESSFLEIVFGCVCQSDPENSCEQRVAKIKVTYKDVGGDEQGGGTVSATSSPATPGYEVIEATDVVAPYEAPKAVTVQGVVYDGGKVVGIVELKLGKVNAQKGTGRVSGSVTTLDGKKHAIQAVNLTGIDGATPKAVSLEVKDFGTMSITIGGTQFAGAMGKYHVQSAAVGGDWTKGDAKVYVDTEEASIPPGTWEAFLPDGEPVIASGGKWKFAKAASVKWGTPKQSAGSQEVVMELFDATTGKGIMVDTSAGKTNLSAMKLTYTPKKGTFKGSFKVYVLEGVGKARKLKKYTVNVSGVVVGGVGYGTATCKKPAVNWAVTVK